MALLAFPPYAIRRTKDTRPFPRITRICVVIAPAGVLAVYDGIGLEPPLDLAPSVGLILTENQSIIEVCLAHAVSLSLRISTASASLP